MEDDRPLDTEEQGPSAQQAWQEAYYVLLLLTKTVKSSAREVGMPYPTTIYAQRAQQPGFCFPPSCS